MVYTRFPAIICCLAVFSTYNCYFHRENKHFEILTCIISLKCINDKQIKSHLKHRLSFILSQEISWQGGEHSVEPRYKLLKVLLLCRKTPAIQRFTNFVHHVTHGVDASSHRRAWKVLRKTVEQVAQIPSNQTKPVIKQLFYFSGFNILLRSGLAQMEKCWI